MYTAYPSAASRGDKSSWPASLLQMSKGRAFTDNASVSLIPLPGERLLALSGEAGRNRKWYGTSSTVVCLHGNIDRCALCCAFCSTANCMALGCSCTMGASGSSRVHPQTKQWHRTQLRAERAASWLGDPVRPRGVAVMGSEQLTILRSGSLHSLDT